jgi:predicted MFS family arabinose efflux permease
VGRQEPSININIHINMHVLDHDNLSSQSAVHGHQSGTKKAAASATVTAVSEPYCVTGTYGKIFSLTSIAMVITMIATKIVLPVLPILQAEYGVTTTQMNLLVTVFSLVQRITPALMSSLSDLQGRRIAWMFSLALYTAANIGLAAQDSYIALIVLRCFQSLAAAAPFHSDLLSQRISRHPRKGADISVRCREV